MLNFLTWLAVLALLFAAISPILARMAGVLDVKRWGWVVYYGFLLLSVPGIWIFVPGARNFVDLPYWIFALLTEYDIRPIWYSITHLFPILLSFLWIVGLLILKKWRGWVYLDSRDRKRASCLLIASLTIISLYQSAFALIRAAFFMSYSVYSTVNTNERFVVQVFQRPGKMGPAYEIWRFPNKPIAPTGIRLGAFETNRHNSQLPFYYGEDFQKGAWSISWDQESDILLIKKGDLAVFGYKDASRDIEEFPSDRTEDEIDVTQYGKSSIDSASEENLGK